MLFGTFTAAVQVVFLVLKLTGELDWSWWWVLSPVFFDWGCIALIALIVILVKLADAGQY